MRRVVITGATSMIGVALIEECIQNNVEVLAIIRRQSVHRYRLPQSDLIHVLECDMNEIAEVKDIESNYDVFYHLAWSGTNKKDRNNAVIQEKNIEYTLQAVKLAHWLGCRKFVGAGSQAEYGQVKGIISPETAIAPLTAYGIAKYAAGRLSEQLCTQYGMVHIWARVFSVYGKLDNEKTMLNYAMECFTRHEVAQLSAATQMWDYLYEEDAGKIFFLLGKYIEENKVYCVASGKARPLKEYVIELQHEWGENAECEFALRCDDRVIGIQADIQGLVQDINYFPSTEFRDGIARVIKYKKQTLNGDMV